MKRTSKIRKPLCGPNFLANGWGNTSLTGRKSPAASGPAAACTITARMSGTSCHLPSRLVPPSFAFRPLWARGVWPGDRPQPAAMAIGVQLGRRPLRASCSSRHSDRGGARSSPSSRAGHGEAARGSVPPGATAQAAAWAKHPPPNQDPLLGLVRQRAGIENSWWGRPSRSSRRPKPSRRRQQPELEGIPAASNSNAGLRLLAAIALAVRRPAIPASAPGKSTRRTL